MNAILNISQELTKNGLTMVAWCLKSQSACLSFKFSASTEGFFKRMSSHHPLKEAQAPASNF
jgi:hypothetical protein